MAWFDRPEGFVTKSTDIYAPPVEVATGIKLSVRIGTLTQTIAHCIHYDVPGIATHCDACPACNAEVAER
jgi:hypothetical protein